MNDKYNNKIDDSTNKHFELNSFCCKKPHLKTNYQGNKLRKNLKC